MLTVPYPSRKRVARAMGLFKRVRSSQKTSLFVLDEEFFQALPGVVKGEFRCWVARPAHVLISIMGNSTGQATPKAGDYEACLTNVSASLRCLILLRYFAACDNPYGNPFRFRTFVSPFFQSLIGLEELPISLPLSKSLSCSSSASAISFHPFFLHMNDLVFII
ncbi:hypothetical protein E2542_SST03746 [Spatholobus suberectus]|nr:hypothetical protein E2542_SST03746 [Spatholobus suberectus]